MPGKPGLKSFEAYEESPFGIYGVVDKQVIKKGSNIVITSETGRKWNMQTASTQKVVKHDPAPYVKVFRGSTIALRDLSKRGFVLLLFIIEHLPIGRNSIFITRESAGAFSKSLRGASYYAAIIDLLTYGVILRSTITDKYFVNPNILFNGSRAKSRARKDSGGPN